jgi:hypothetical protein
MVPLEAQGAGHADVGALTVGDDGHPRQEAVVVEEQM